MKRQYLKYACLTAGLMTAVAFPSSLRAEDPPAAPATPPAQKEGRPEMTPEQREAARQKRLDELATKLSLDDSQKEKLKTIFDEQKEKMTALREDSSLDKDAKRAKMGEIMKETHDAIAGILTDEQKAKFAEMKEHGPGGPGGGGGFGGGHHGDKGGNAPAPATPQPTT